MSLNRDYDDSLNSSYYDSDKKEDEQTLSHRRELRKKIEERMESKRLKEACQDDWDELNDEFKWEELDK